MKKILVINSGSSSLKFQLIAMPEETVIASGLVERIGMDDANYSFESIKNKDTKVLKILDHHQALELVAVFLLDIDLGVISSPKEIDAIGHRVVHGGKHFSDTTLITNEIKQKIHQLSSLAPLHNPPNLVGIEVAVKIFPDAKQVAVFDTAFHQSIPEKAHRYAIPKELYEKEHIRLYGFHGTSHKYVSEKATAYLNNPKSKIIVLHLGNGCSATAINAAKSVDHSLGFGPLTGLVMGTRSGDIDPAIILYLMETKGYSYQEISNLLNKKSGMLGLTGFSDMREIQKGYTNGDPDCIIALEMNVHRIKKYIGAYAAAMNGLDALVFTAGIGENSSMLREMVCSEMDFLGIELSQEKNNSKEKGIREIQSDNSRAKVMIVPTNEELEIAKQSFELIN
ncbi:MAG: acetate kinase [Leadbetterella sp.]|nr:acetate kinase [Leadbetterella sp.]